MLNKEQISAYEDLYELTHIPFIIMHLDGTPILSLPQKLSDFYLLENLSNPPDTLGKSSHPDGITLISVDDVMRLAIVKLDKMHYIVTAPIAITFQRMHITSWLLKHCKADSLNEFIGFLSTIPADNIYRLSSFASLAKYIYTGKTASEINFYQPSEYMDELIETKEKPIDSPYDKNEYEETPPHSNDTFLERLCRAVEEGDRDRLMRVMKSPYQGQIGKMSGNRMQQQKYACIISLYAASRAAIRGGVSQETALDLSDIFCQQLDFLKSESEIEHHQRNCWLKFCREVELADTQKHYSPYTRKALHYISHNLYSPMTTQDIADNVHLNRCTLSEYFRHDTGKTLHEYINSERLYQARYLLTNSELSLSQLSELLCYSNQSHFARRFKEAYGVTPNQYRSQHAP